MCLTWSFQSQISPLSLNVSSKTHIHGIPISSDEFRTYFTLAVKYVFHLQTSIQSLGEKCA
jgi:hypothetical protein